MKKYDSIIIGAGAAGLMCAIEAGKRGRTVVVLDKASKAGKKILISGGGRCNFTNLYTSPEDFLSRNPHFCKSALSRYTPWDFIALLESHGLSWTEKTLGQLFCNQKSVAVVEALIIECKKTGVDVQLDCDIKSITKDSIFTLNSSTGNYQSDSVVVATGGPSIPKMGASDFAIRLAKQFDIKTVPFSPALVPFIFDADILDHFIRDLSGISTSVKISLVAAENHQLSRARLQLQLTRRANQNESKYGGVSFKEAILFTHRGISGPAALQISSYWNQNDKICINLFPDFNLLGWLKEQQQAHPQTELKTILAYKLPKRLATTLCKLLTINKIIKRFSITELETVTEQLTHWQLHPSGTEGMRTAEVSLGGIDTDELSSKTFETKKIKGLYFIGEAVDVTGHLGGFNFQWAWSSGWCAGQTI